MPSSQFAGPGPQPSTREHRRPLSTPVPHRSQPNRTATARIITCLLARPATSLIAPPTVRPPGSLHSIAPGNHRYPPGVVKDSRAQHRHPLIAATPKKGQPRGAHSIGVVAACSLSVDLPWAIPQLL
ncbi:hypothetical protein BDV95DRAFT_38558 [Massariosphaeria phaeospora]|uniref:Uncharacterized protein n=1 Tax=Massariosphaeria phaeospora TaxID=100035 RepID=A0A7C8MAP3_9PLEO|nr:hypothetical protein BDV95DRAFT_38558 [Massariosphaeria phaeospora]